MAKRTRKQDNSSDDEFDDFSAESDASFAPDTSKKRTRQSKATQSKKRRVTTQVRRTLVSEDVQRMTITDNNGELASASLHTVSSHVIGEPEPLREALLVWYAGVHEARGMPWRKPYDSSFTREQRAQRAYEVCSTMILADRQCH